MFKFLKRNLKTITLVASLLLNALGGAGVIPPVLANVAASAVNAAGN